MVDTVNDQQAFRQHNPAEQYENGEPVPAGPQAPHESKQHLFDWACHLTVTSEAVELSLAD
jgi:hypothetical protein